MLQDVLTDKECCEALTEAQMDRLMANTFSDLDVLNCLVYPITSFFLYARLKDRAGALKDIAPACDCKVNLVNKSSINMQNVF